MKARSLFIMLVMLACCIALPSFALEIRLHSQVSLDAEHISLADIAIFRDGGQADTARLGAISVHRFGANEREFRIAYAQIERAIRAEYSGPLMLVGSNVLVRRKVSTITQRDMLAAIDAHFKQHFPHLVFEANTRSLPSAREYMGGGISLGVDFRPSRGRNESIASGPFASEIIVRKSGGEIDRIYFDGRIRIPGRVLEAARPLERGRTLRPGDVRFKEVADIGRERVFTFEELAGRRILEDIPEGTRLSAEQFERPILVRRGMRVTVVWQRDGVSIEAEAVAIDEGREGDIVRLRNAFSGREFNARVGASPGRVYSNG